MKKISFCGDIHGSFKTLHYVYKKEKPDYIIQCGDFGIWTEHDKYLVQNPDNVPIYWCRGNHENHTLLDTIYAPEKGDMNSIYPMKNKFFPKADNIFLCNTGSLLIIEATNILFLGGGDSIDKSIRKFGSSWWPQEIPSKECMEQVLNNDYGVSIDIIVSHTAPASIVKKMPLITNDFADNLTYHDPTTDFLEECYKKLRPRTWIYGHFHLPFIYKDKDCSFTALNSCSTYNPQNFDQGFYKSILV